MWIALGVLAYVVLGFVICVWLRELRFGSWDDVPMGDWEPDPLFALMAGGCDGSAIRGSRLGESAASLYREVGQSVTEFFRSQTRIDHTAGVIESA